MMGGRVPELILAMRVDARLLVQELDHVQVPTERCQMERCIAPLQTIVTLLPCQSDTKQQTALRSVGSGSYRCWKYLTIS